MNLRNGDLRSRVIILKGFLEICRCGFSLVKIIIVYVDKYIYLYGSTYN